MEDYGLVSVITASYNMANYLPMTIDSVLAQSYPNLEIVVVDDGSEDDTPRVMESYSGNPRVRYVRLEQNQGQTVAKNRGLSEARGEFLSFVDADNLWKPSKLEHQLPLFGASGKTGVVYSDAEYIDGEGALLPYVKRSYHQGRITDQLLLSNFVNFNSAVVRRECIEKVGGFDENLRMGIDWDLWLRISTGYEFTFLPEQTYSYRIWANQMSHQKKKRFQSAATIVDKFERENPKAAHSKTLAAARALIYKDSAFACAAVGEKREAYAFMARAIRQCPTMLVVWKGLARLILKG
jgi:glycosyltransferase involved in cell wall biosynthesis